MKSHQSFVCEVHTSQGATTLSSEVRNAEPISILKAQTTHLCSFNTFVGSSSPHAQSNFKCSPQGTSTLRRQRRNLGPRRFSKQPERHVWERETDKCSLPPLLNRREHCSQAFMSSVSFYFLCFSVVGFLWLHREKSMPLVLWKLLRKSKLKLSL